MSFLYGGDPKDLFKKVWFGGGRRGTANCGIVSWPLNDATNGIVNQLGGRDGHFECCDL